MLRLRAMLRIRALVLLLPVAACHGMFGARTTDEDKELNNFAAARERAATYYDDKDYLRAAAQFKKALGYRPGHVPTRLGYAYSLMYTDQPSQLKIAEQELKRLGRQSERDLEFKRAYGLGMTYRNLAVHYQRRSRLLRDQKKLPESDADLAAARDYARDGIRWFQVVEKDDRISSMKPDAYLGMGHCSIILEDFDAAIRNIQTFADLASRARRYWESRRERLLVMDRFDPKKIVPETGEFTPEENRLYEGRVRRTIEEETTARSALVETYLWLQRNADALAECDRILGLDPEHAGTYYIRGRVHASMGDYRKGLDDLKAYRKRQDLSKLTDELVRLNILIRTYEEKLKGEGAKGS